MVGAHNLENILCAAGVGMALDVPLSVVKAGIEKLDRFPILLTAGVVGAVVLARRK